MSLRDSVKAREDVKELLVSVPMWDDEKVLFRGLSFAALQTIQGVDLEAAVKKQDIGEMIRTLQATMADPETKELVFADDEGAEILRSKSFEAIMWLMLNGANKVLGIDVDNEAGKGSSSTVTEPPTPGD